MYKLYADQKDGSNIVYYQNGVTPHLWLIAAEGKRSISKSQFCDNLLDIASDINDDLFTNEVANLIAILKMDTLSELQISGVSATQSSEELKNLVDSFDYEKIFGDHVNKVEYYETAESKEYFKEYQKTYKAQYRNMTNILVMINVIVFIFNLIFSYIPLQFIWGGSLLSIWTWISILFAGFTQLSLLHIFFNMSFLMSLGQILERVLGKTKYLTVYFVSLFVSGIFVVLFSNSPTAGASGALYGLFAFFICLTLKHETNQQQIRNVLSTFGINILFTLLAPGISVAGHLGGAVAGVIMFLIYNRK